MALRVQIASDLHTEFFPTADAAFAAIFGGAPPAAPTLALLGDIGYINQDVFSNFLRLCMGAWEEVWLLHGNHEFWSEKREGKVVPGGTPERARAIVDELNAAPGPHGLVRLLSRTAFDAGGVRVIGATLWFHVPLPEPRAGGDAAFFSALNHGCTDFTKVKVGKERLCIEGVRELHRGDVAFIAAELAAARAEGRPALVLTHHAPVLDARALGAADAPNAAVAAYFEGARAREAGEAGGTALDLSPEDAARAAACASSGADLRSLLAPGTTWCFGHTHCAADFEERGARLRSNPAGYVHEAGVKARFMAGCVVEVQGQARGAPAGAAAAAGGQEGREPPPAPHACAACAAPATLRCSRCQRAWFCGAACQKSAWPAHRLDCLSPQAAAQQAELTQGMKALLEEYGEAAEDLSAWTYDEDRDGGAPLVGAGAGPPAGAGGSIGGGAAAPGCQPALSGQQLAAKALLERVIGKGLEGGE